MGMGMGLPSPGGRRSSGLGSYAEWLFSPNGLVLRGQATPITFSRASNATYWDSDGNLQVAGNNALRIDHDSATGECLGLLSEGQKTNKVTSYNATPNDTSGVGTGQIADGVLTVVNDDSELQAAGLDGIVGNVYKLDNSAGSDFSSITIVADTVGGSILHSASLFVRGSGTGFVRPANTSTPSYRSLPASYERWFLSGTPSSSATSMFFRVSAGSIAYFILAQTEEGGNSSPIITEGSSAIRAEDVLNVTDMSWFNPSHGVLIAKVRAYPGSVIGSTRRIAVIGSGQNALRFSLGSTGGWPYSEVGNGTSLSSALGAGSTVVDSAVWEYIAFSYSTTGPHCFARRRGNAAATSGIRGGDTYSGATPASMSIGINLNGHLPWLRYEPRLITSGSELQAILDALPAV